MALEFDEKKIILKDNVSIEEAEQLFEHFLREENSIIDLSQCEHMHTAILQLILLFRMKFKIEGLDKFNISF